MKTLENIIAQLKEYESPAITEMKPGKTEGPGKLVGVRFSVAYDLDRFMDDYPNLLDELSRNTYGQLNEHLIKYGAEVATEELFDEFLTKFDNMRAVNIPGKDEYEIIKIEPTEDYEPDRSLVKIPFSEAKELASKIEGYLSTTFVNVEEFRYVQQ